MKGPGQFVEERNRFVLFEDNHLLIVNKMPGEIVQGDKTGDKPLSEIYKDYLKIRYEKPGNVFLGVVHRIDRPVSGAVLFARTSKALTRLNNMLKEGSIRKTYWAVTSEAPPKDEDELIHYLTRNEQQNKSYASGQEKAGALRSVLKYRLRAKSERMFLLEIQLMTGRHHQIRAQLAAIGCPIRGDLKYGYPRSNPDGSIHLHSRVVSFMHPVKDIPVEITAEPPKEKIWDLFRDIANRGAQ